jgi:tryptophanyl-tRNA synthetase
VQNLVGIYAACAGITQQQVLDQFAGKGFGVFKPALAEVLVTELAPVATEMRRLLADQAALDSILRNGADRARAIAAPIMDQVRDVVGLWR